MEAANQMVKLGFLNNKISSFWLISNFFMEFFFISITDEAKSLNFGGFP